MEKYLREFNGDKQTREAVLQFLVFFFEGKIIERALKGEDVKSLAEAINELRKGFDQLEIDYGLKATPPKPVNQSK